MLMEKIQQDLVIAMKQKEQLKLNTLRSIKTALTNKEIDLGHPLDPALQIAVLTTLKKQREDASTQYLQAGRTELALQEQQELAIIQQYLPEPLSMDELKIIIEATIQEQQATSIKAMGQVVKSVIDKTKGRADGKIISTEVKSRLS